MPDNVSHKTGGTLFVISAPSGTGKTTICSAVLKKVAGVSFSVSHTTRKPREGEEHGKDYFFISVDEFKEKISNSDWLEWAEVHGNYYGTSREFIESALGEGRSVLLDIDVQGALQVKSLYPGAVMIFIKPPSLDSLEERLISRGTDSRDVIERRLANARKEMEQADHYGHVIVNDCLDEAIEEMTGILKKN